MRTFPFRFTLVFLTILVLSISPFTSTAFAAPDQQASVLSEPDAFGYRWETLPNEFPTDPMAGLTKMGWPSTINYVPFPLSGPAFPFYENKYQALSICTNGVILMGTTACPVQGPMETLPQAEPNAIYLIGSDFTAPDPSAVKSGIYTGYQADQNRYAVLWYHDPTESWGRMFTTLVYLYTNGNIEIRYSLQNVNLPQSFSIGIVNANQDIFLPIAFSDLSFIRSAFPSARSYRIERSFSVERNILLKSQALEVTPGNQYVFPIRLYNAGDRDPAAQITYQITSDNSACVILAGGSPLANPVTLAQGSSLALDVSMTIPGGVSPGYYTACQITAAYPNGSQSVQLSGVLPMPFLQTFNSFDMKSVQHSVFHFPDSSQVLETHMNNGSDMTPNEQSAAVTLTNGWMLLVYPQYEQLQTYPGVTLYAQLVDPNGVVGTPVILDQTLNPVSTYLVMGDIALAVSPQGDIGVVWVASVEKDTAAYSISYELKFALLSADGSIKKPPVVLDHKQDSAEPFAYIYRPALAANSSGKFGLIWETGKHQRGVFTDSQLQYLSLDSNGEETFRKQLTSYPQDEGNSIDPFTITSNIWGGFFITFSRYNNTTKILEHRTLVNMGPTLEFRDVEQTTSAVFDSLLLPDGDIVLAEDTGIEVYSGTDFRNYAGYSDLFTAPDRPNQNFGFSASLALADENIVIVTFFIDFQQPYYIALKDGQSPLFEPVKFQLTNASSLLFSHSPYALAVPFYSPPPFLSRTYLPAIQR